MRATSEAHALAQILESTGETDSETLRGYVKDLQQALNLTEDPEMFNEVCPEDESVVIDPINGGKCRITFHPEE